VGFYGNERKRIAGASKEAVQENSVKLRK